MCLAHPFLFLINCLLKHNLYHIHMIKAVERLITLSELQLKEVVILQSGRRLGFIADFEIDERTGSITAFIVSTRQLRGNLFNRMTETIVTWEHIVTIGDDIILINDENYSKTIENNGENEANE